MMCAGHTSNLATFGCASTQNICTSPYINKYRLQLDRAGEQRVAWLLVGRLTMQELERAIACLPNQAYTVGT
jgi:hypothetical protein